MTGASEKAGPQEGQREPGPDGVRTAQAEQALRPSRTWTRARGLDLRTWNIAVLRPQPQCPPARRGRQGASSWEHGCSPSPCGYGRTQPTFPLPCAWGSQGLSSRLPCCGGLGGNTVTCVCHSRRVLLGRAVCLPLSHL